MDKVRFILICTLILSTALDNINIEAQFSKENSPKVSLRRLEFSFDNYILVEYTSNFTNNLEGFLTPNNVTKIAHLYMNGDNKTDYISSIQSIDIKPGTILMIVFNTPPTTLDSFFHQMTKIKSIDFSHFDSTEVKSMNGLFSGCNES